MLQTLTGSHMNALDCGLRINDKEHLWTKVLLLVRVQHTLCVKKDEITTYS